MEAPFRGQVQTRTSPPWAWTRHPPGGANRRHWTMPWKRGWMMKSLIGTFVVVMSLLLATTNANAQEMSFRSGVVTGVTPMQVQAEQASTGGGGSRVGGALGRMFGRAVGKAGSRATGGGAHEGCDVGNRAAQRVAQGAPSSGRRTQDTGAG